MHPAVWVDDRLSSVFLVLHGQPKNAIVRAPSDYSVYCILFLDVPVAVTMAALFAYIYMD